MFKSLQTQAIRAEKKCTNSTAKDKKNILKKCIMFWNAKNKWSL